MAILESLGLAVSVVMDGTAAQEYDDPEPSLEYKGKKIDPTVTAVCNKYIVASDKTEYLIHLEVMPQNTWVGLNEKNVLTFRIYIDGKHRCSTPFRRQDLKDGYGESHEKGVRTYDSTGWSMRKFRFDTITATDAGDNQTIEADKERAADLGTIRVVVRRKLFLKYSPWSKRNHKDANLTIAETALKGKAVSHGTAFPISKTCQPNRAISSATVDDCPVAIFNFKYRSRNALRQEMIIPRTPSPTPAQVLAGLDQAELQRLAMERLIDLRIKRENQWQGVKTEAGIKSEPGTRPRPVKREFTDASDLTRDSNIASPQPRRKMARLSNGRLEIDLTNE